MQMHSSNFHFNENISLCHFSSFSQVFVLASHNFPKKYIKVCGCNIKNMKKLKRNEYFWKEL